MQLNIRLKKTQIRYDNQKFVFAMHSNKTRQYRNSSLTLIHLIHQIQTINIF